MTGYCSECGNTLCICHLPSYDLPRDDRTTQMRTRAVGMRDTLTAGYLTWAADEIDSLRAQVIRLQAELDMRAPDEVNEQENQ